MSIKEVNERIDIPLVLDGCTGPEIDEMEYLKILTEKTNAEVNEIFDVLNRSILSAFTPMYKAAIEMIDGTI